MGIEADRAKRLIEEDPDFTDALEAVLAQADDEDELEWSDVQDDLTSGQWGRLIQEGILVSGDDGFRLADPEGIRSLLEDGGESIGGDLPEIDADVSWSTYDKLAGLLTLMFMVGYWFNPVRNTIGESIYTVFRPLEATLPFMIVIFAIAMITGLYSTLLQANLTNTEVVAAYQEQMEAVQERRKEAEERGDDEAMEAIREEQMEAMGGMLQMFKAQFRPMVWITLLTIPVFLWLYWFVGSGRIPENEMQVVLPIFGQFRWDGTLIGPMPSWILWYILCSISFTQIMRKALNVQTSPT